TLGDNLGALTLSAAREDYWNDGKSMASWSVGYSNYWHNISYGLTWTYSKNVRSASETRDSQKNADHDQLLAFNVSIRLDRLWPTTWANYGVDGSGSNATTRNVGLNGVAPENRALSWKVHQGHGTEGVGYTDNVNADNKGAYGEVTA